MFILRRGPKNICGRLRMTCGYLAMKEHRINWKRKQGPNTNTNTNATGRHLDFMLKMVGSHRRMLSWAVSWPDSCRKISWHCVKNWWIIASAALYNTNYKCFRELFAILFNYLHIIIESKSLRETEMVLIPLLPITSIIILGAYLNKSEPSVSFLHNEDHNT